MLTPPILFGFSLHGRRFRIFDLHPMRCTARAIERAKSLGHDALAAKFAGVGKENIAVTFKNLVQDNPGLRPSYQLG